MTASLRLETCLLGIILGDSLGLPTEGLSSSRASKLFPGALRQRMAFGRGVLSDDSIMAVATLQALYACPDDPQGFSIELGRRLRRWFWTMPPGIGLATLKACVRLTVGFSANRSGVNSAGNGPAIRAVVLGCALASDPEKRTAFIDASTRVTHTHRVAICGSQLAGLAAALSATKKEGRFRCEASQVCPAWAWEVAYPESGPSGYMLHTINAAIQCWQLHPFDLASAIRLAISLGGDTDSVAALVGGIVAAGNGNFFVPNGWYAWLGWPRRQDLLGIAAGVDTKMPLNLVLSNLLTLCLVLLHVFRRMLPPY